MRDFVLSIVKASWFIKVPLIKVPLIKVPLIRMLLGLLVMVFSSAAFSEKR